MSFPRALSVVGLVLLLAAGPALRAIELAGVDGSETPPRLSLYDPATGAREWVRSGAIFAGARVLAYDPARQSVRLVRDKREWEVRLRGASIAAEAPLSEAEQKSITTRVTGNLRMLRAALDQFCLEHGVDSARYDQLVGDNSYIKKIVPADGEDYKTLELRQLKTWTIRTARGVEVSYSL